MAVSTPCTGVCTMDRASGFCHGCGRTLAEIAAWGTMAEAERLAVMATLPARRPRRRSDGHRHASRS